MTHFTPEELEFLASIFAAARSGDADLVSRALEAGMPPNMTNEQGDTLLILAAYYCREPVVDVLLRAGADTERVNDRGQTALAAAVFRQHAGIVRRLLDAGADPEHGERSALSIAQFFQLDDMAALLNKDEGTGEAVPQG